MKRPTAWITAALLLATTAGASAQAIDIRTDDKVLSAIQTEEKVRSAMMTAATQEARQQAVQPTRHRSKSRTWSGIALAAAGAATALMGRTCRATGSLPRDAVRPFHDVSVMTSMTDLYAYRADGECRIDFQIHVSIKEHGPNPRGYPDHHESYLYRDLHHYSKQSLPENLSGTARATDGLEPRRLYTGVAMAATGVALATIFADIPLRVTEMSPSRIALGSRISW